MSWEELLSYCERQGLPHLVPFIEADDVDIRQAEQRYDECMREARAALRRAGIDVRRCQITPSGLDTTSLAMPVGEVYETRSTATMQMATTSHVQVENDQSKVLRGIAVPFAEPTLILDADGNPIREEFSRDSFDRLPAAPVPLLVGHRRDAPPAGVVREFGFLPQGLAFEGELIGGDHEVEGWRRKMAAGLSDSVSVGFTQAKSRARWSRPERRGATPRVSPRGVEVVEMSIVNFPAYPTAKVVTLSERSADGQQRHEESERAIHDWQRWKIEQQVRGRLSGR